MKFYFSLFLFLFFQVFIYSQKSSDIDLPKDWISVQYVRGIGFENSIVELQLQRKLKITEKYIVSGHINGNVHIGEFTYNYNWRIGLSVSGAYRFNKSFYIGLEPTLDYFNDEGRVTYNMKGYLGSYFGRRKNIGIDMILAIGKVQVSFDNPVLSDTQAWGNHFKNKPHLGLRIKRAFL